MMRFALAFLTIFMGLNIDATTTETLVQPSHGIVINDHDLREYQQSNVKLIEAESAATTHSIMLTRTKKEYETAIEEVRRIIGHKRSDISKSEERFEKYRLDIKIKKEEVQNKRIYADKLRKKARRYGNNPTSVNANINYDGSISGTVQGSQGSAVSRFEEARAIEEQARDLEKEVIILQEKCEFEETHIVEMKRQLVDLQHGYSELLNERDRNVRSFNREIERESNPPAPTPAVPASKP